MAKGNVFNIQRFSVNDGPGIRTTIFLKGCPLNCLWCHNPESIRPEPEISFSRQFCRGCGRCVSVCRKGCIKVADTAELDRNRCNLCGDCVKSCIFGALKIIGKYMSADEVMEEAIKDKHYYEASSGGITISGGEPMFQSVFTLEILKKAKQSSVHTCLETCGFCDFEKLKECSSYTDIFLYDYKESDSMKHKRFTGAGNEIIRENLLKLDEIGKNIILRCPIIPGKNDTSGHFRGIAEMANRLKNVIEINVEPYHPIGKSKSQQIGREYELEGLSFVDDDISDKWVQEIKKNTDIKTVKI